MNAYYKQNGVHRTYTVEWEERSLRNSMVVRQDVLRDTKTWGTPAVVVRVVSGDAGLTNVDAFMEAAALVAAVARQWATDEGSPA